MFFSILNDELTAAGGRGCEYSAEHGKNRIRRNAMRVESLR